MHTFYHRSSLRQYLHFKGLDINFHLMDSPNVYIYIAMLTKQQHFLGKYLAMLYGNFIAAFERVQIHLPCRLVQITTGIRLPLL